MQTLNYQLKRFCNYLILNLSIHYRYIIEIGLLVKEKEVFITLRTEEANFGNADKGLNDIFNSFNTAKTELAANGIIFNVDIKVKSFQQNWSKD